MAAWPKRHPPSAPCTDLDPRRQWLEVPASSEVASVSSAELAAYHTLRSSSRLYSILQQATRTSSSRLHMPKYLIVLTSGQHASHDNSRRRQNRSHRQENMVSFALPCSYRKPPALAPSLLGTFAQSASLVPIYTWNRAHRPESCSLSNLAFNLFLRPCLDSSLIRPLSNPFPLLGVMGLINVFQSSPFGRALNFNPEPWRHASLLA